MVMVKECRKCNTSLPLTSFYKRKDLPDGLQYKCKECMKVENSIRYVNNRDTYLEKVRQHYNDNKETLLKRKKEYYIENREEIRSKQNAYKKTHRGKYNSYEMERYTDKLKASPKWRDRELIKVVYEKAKWLESLTGLKYHVDHIVPLKGKNVCGLHCWQNLQILEASLNCSKSNKE